MGHSSRGWYQGSAELLKRTLTPRPPNQFVNTSSVPRPRGKKERIFDATAIGHAIHIEKKILGKRLDKICFGQSGHALL
jgi:hypothetical protein